MKKFVVITFALMTSCSYGFRCGTTLIDISTSQEDVKTACGKPTRITITKETVPGDLCQKDNDDCMAVETIEGDGTKHVLYYEKKIVEHPHWIYEFGSTELVQTLSFSNGKVSNIREGNYGD